MKQSAAKERRRRRKLVARAAYESVGNGRNGEKAVAKKIKAK